MRPPANRVGAAVSSMGFIGSGYEQQPGNGCECEATGLCELRRSSPEVSRASPPDRLDEECEMSQSVIAEEDAERTGRRTRSAAATRADGSRCQGG